MHVGRRVRCVRGHEGACLEEGELYDVAVVVHEGSDYLNPVPGEAQGVIVTKAGHYGPHLFPYLWDSDRFEPQGEIIRGR